MDNDEKSTESLALNESFQRYCLGVDNDAVAYWEKWLNDNPAHRVEFFKAKQLYKILNGNNHSVNFEKDRAIFLDRLKKKGFVTKVSEAAVVDMPAEAETKRTVSFYRLAVAAAVFGALVLGGFLLMKNNSESRPSAKTENGKKQPFDKAPGINVAILTLADGTVINLDSAAEGTITQPGNVKVINTRGLLTYMTAEDAEPTINTISTPKGGQYQLLLADGTKVWLNALSSIRFPSVFKGTERSVELTGEGYFEVAHDAIKPFHVNVNNFKIEVLGTHFNISAYEDEEQIKTTLLQGKVKVQKGPAFSILSPGQQARVNAQGVIKIDKNADIDQAVAWKNGLFQFSGADMGTVMRNIGRWYNIETVIKGNMENIHLSGKVSRKLNLSQVITILEESGVDIQEMDNKLIASPKL